MPRQAPRVRVAVPRVPAAAADPLKLRKAPKVRSVVVDPKASKKAGRPAKAKGDGEGIAPPPPFSNNYSIISAIIASGDKKALAAIQQYITKEDESLVRKQERKAAKHAAKKAAAVALAKAEAAAAALETSEEGKSLRSTGFSPRVSSEAEEALGGTLELRVTTCLLPLHVS